MKIIVCPHELAMGGSQINAIELAASMRDRGHDVVVYAPDGELRQKVDDLRLKYVRSSSGTRVSLEWARGLAKLIRKFNPDIVHTYEWAASISAAYFLLLPAKTKQVMTVLSMDVPGFLPSYVPLTVGTRELAESLKRNSEVAVIEPPIDTTANQTRNIQRARESLSVAADDVVISIVCRMTNELDKAGGVLAAIAAVDRLATLNQVKLIIAGDGPELDLIKVHATEVNQRHSRKIIDVLGSVLEPETIYDGSDVVLGMGSSVLRGMAFGKPVIVQGANGYWELLTVNSLATFLWGGFYGKDGGGADELTLILERLIEDRQERNELGCWSRSVVEDYFSLNGAAISLEKLYLNTVDKSTRNGDICISTFRSIGGFVKFNTGKLIKKFVKS